MKSPTLIILLLLAIACSKPGENSTSQNDSTANTSPTPPKPVNVAIWNQVGVHDTPSDKGKYITSVYLGEKFEITGDTSNKYHKIKLSDGKTGWVRDELIAIGVQPAAVMSDAAVYKRPDLATVTEKSFVRGDFIVIRKTENSFIEVTGKLSGDKWFTNGFIKADNVSYDDIEVEYVAVKARAAVETNEKLKAALQAQVDNEDIFSESMLWSADHGYPGAMGHSGAGADDDNEESDTTQSTDDGSSDIPHFAIDPPKNGLVAFFPLDDMNANDASGNDNNGRMFDVSPSGDKIKSKDGAMTFNGASHISILSLKIQPPFSVAAYFKLENERLSSQCVVSRGREANGTGFNFGYSTGENGDKFFYFGLIGAKPVGIDVPANIQASQWVFLTATLDDRVASLYVNGQLAKTITLSQEDADLVAQNLANSDMPVEIGRELETLDRYFRGSIDNVALWDRALGADEVAGMYK